MSGTPIFLWEAGCASGTAGSPGNAFDSAAPYVAGGAEGTVEEAVVVMVPAGPAGSVPEHRRTGRAWRGRLRHGAPSWERTGPGGAPAG